MSDIISSFIGGLFGGAFACLFLTSITVGVFNGVQKSIYNENPYLTYLEFKNEMSNSQNYEAYNSFASHFTKNGIGRKFIENLDSYNICLSKVDNPSNCEIYLKNLDLIILNLLSKDNAI